jgi:hypothetical protein
VNRDLGIPQIPVDEKTTSQAQSENCVQAVEPMSIAFFTWKLISGDWGEISCQWVCLGVPHREKFLSGL